MLFCESCIGGKNRSHVPTVNVALSISVPFTEKNEMVARLCWSKIIGGQGLGFHEWPISEHITVSVTMEKPHSVEQLSQSIV